MPLINARREAEAEGRMCLLRCHLCAGTVNSHISWMWDFGLLWSFLGPTKYRDGKTGDTWSGRGRMASWLKSKQEAGEKIEKYLLN